MTLFNRPCRLILALLFASIITPAIASSLYILEMKPGADPQPIVTKYGFTILRSWEQLEHSTLSVTSPQPLSSAAFNSLKAEKGVLEVESDGIIKSSDSPSNSWSKATLATNSLEAPGAWFKLTSVVNYFGSNVHTGYVTQPTTALVGLADEQKKYGTGAGIVAIIDTGVDPNHAALRNVIMPGYDFIKDSVTSVSEFSGVNPLIGSALQQSTVEILDSNRVVVQMNATTSAILAQSTVEILDGKNLPSDFGHGTMVAGLVHLIAPRARIMPLKAFNADGTTQMSTIVRAIRYAAEHGATVINMSFSFPVNSPELKAAIDYATRFGAICIASSGNAGKGTNAYPASLSNVIGVGSTNYSDKRSPFSNYGNSAETSAPGEAIVTTYPGNTYAAVWGTSFSSALASGAAALFRQKSPGLRFSDVKDAFDQGIPIDQKMGEARLQLMLSLNYLSKKDN